MMVGSESGGSRGSQSQDFELNLASIIDCLTVLIAFILASASFLSIGILDAGIAAAGTTAADTTPPPINITVELAPAQALVVKVSGKATSTTSIAAKAGSWDYETLTQNLAGLKQKWPGVNAVILTAENDIEYKNVVKSMEVIRKTLPIVLLGGF